MKIFSSLENTLPPVVLTIGNFDGVHLGHQAVLQEVIQRSKSLKIPSCVLTFSNHPSWILRPQNKIPLITSFSHKLKLIEALGIDYCVAIPFTKEIEEQSAASFISSLLKKIPFQELVLGHDARIGKSREGTPILLQSIADRSGFKLFYCPPKLLEEELISSSFLRNRIEKGDLQEVKKRLGRPWSILGKVLPGEDRGKALGFPTANIDVSALVLPPIGVYQATVIGLKEPKKAVANLGIAPTFDSRKTPLLEVHLLDFSGNLYSQEIEVIFNRFLREERIFPSIEALQAQIAKDIASVK